MDMAEPVPYQVPSIQDIRKMNREELKQLCDKLRRILIQTVSTNGGHLSANLGVVELTVALHMVFDLPKDQLVWDVGHQCYVHKLLTGRADRFHTLRQEGGISGFPNPKESETDVFVVGHSSTSISAANGLAKAKALTGDDGYVVAVIGDGALTGGLAYEGLCNAGRSKDRLIVVLNDNRMSISKNVGFIARHLAKLRSQGRYIRFKQGINNFLNHIPLIGKPLFRLISQLKFRLKKTVYSKGSMFEDMGFYYLGPVNGHNIGDLCEALLTARALSRPVLLHVETVKGKGYPCAELSPDTYHGVNGFDLDTGETCCQEDKTFSAVFGHTLAELGEQDSRICAMSAAMVSGTCVTEFAAKFPNRFFDVGIAESHAVTFSSGLNQGGMIPVFAVYSPFLQRCYDQLLNDTAIIGSHVVLAIDRAGVVPGDGETHQGLFDVAFLYTIPNVTIFAPATLEELRLRLKQAIYDVPGIAAVRYPKGGELPMPFAYQPDYAPYSYFPKEGARDLIVTYGRIFANAAFAAEHLALKGRPVSILKLNQIRPIDGECIEIIKQYERVFFLEEGARTGGAGQWLGHQLLEQGFAGSYRVQAADGFLGTCTTESGLARLGLDVDGICSFVEQLG